MWAGHFDSKNISLKGISLQIRCFRFWASGFGLSQSSEIVVESKFEAKLEMVMMFSGQS